MSYYIMGWIIVKYDSAVLQGLPVKPKYLDPKTIKTSVKLFDSLKININPSARVQQLK